MGKANYIEMIEYLYENGCPLGHYTRCTVMSAMGDLLGLRQARENGCPWDKATCYYAAYRGRLDMLKYLHENGCPWIRSESGFEDGLASMLQPMVTWTCS